MEAAPSVTLSHCDWQHTDRASPAPATLHYGEYCHKKICRSLLVGDGEAGLCIQIFSCKSKYKVMFSYEAH